jgi:hypothetical protein
MRVDEPSSCEPKSAGHPGKFPAGSRSFFRGQAVVTRRHAARRKSPAKKYQWLAGSPSSAMKDAIENRKKQNHTRSVESTRT